MLESKGQSVPARMKSAPRFCEAVPLELPLVLRESRVHGAPSEPLGHTIQHRRSPLTLPSSGFSRGQGRTP